MRFATAREMPEVLDNIVDVTTAPATYLERKRNRSTGPDNPAQDFILGSLQLRMLSFIDQLPLVAPNYFLSSSKKYRSTRRELQDLADQINQSAMELDR